MNKLGTKLGAIAMSAVMALSFAPSAAITSLAAGGDDLTDATQELSTPVYRLYNPNSGEHLFTTNENECDSLDKNGWDYETIAWYAPSTGDPVFRLYNPNHPLGDHHYTSSEEERDNLIKQGWKLDATAFNTVAEGELLGAPVYSLYNPNAYDLGMATHHLTLSEEEADGLELLGWTNEGPKFYEYAEDLDPEVEELTVSIDNTTPKVGDTLTAEVEPADSTVVYQWYADGKAIEGETDDELLVTIDMIGSKISVAVADAKGNKDVSDETAPVAVYEALEILAAEQKGAKTIHVTFSEAVSTSDKLEVTKNSKALQQAAAPVIIGDGTAADITLADRITAGTYTVTLTPADGSAASSVTFSGQVAKLAGIEFVSDKLIMKDNNYEEGYAYIKGVDQFGGKMSLSGVTVIPGYGTYESYDAETGKITIKAGDTSFAIVKEVPVYVTYQNGADTLAENKTLTVTTMSYLQKLEFGDIKKSDGTERSDKNITLGELKSGKYYVEIKTAEDQYGNPLSAKDLNDQMTGATKVLFVIPDETTNSTYFKTNKFGVVDNKIVLWLAGAADLPGTMDLVVTGASGQTFKKSITITDDPYINQMIVTYPTIYTGEDETDAVEFSATDQYGEEINLYDFCPESNDGVTLEFTDMNHQTTKTTQIKAPQDVTWVVKKDALAKTFKVTMKTTAAKGATLVFTLTTAGLQVTPQTLTVGQRTNGERVDTSLTGGNTLLDPVNTSYNFNQFVKFLSSNDTVMDRVENIKYPKFVENGDDLDLVFVTNPTLNPKQSYFAYAVSYEAAASVDDNGVIAGATNLADDADPTIKYLEDGVGYIPGTYYVTLFKDEMTNDGEKFSVVDKQSFKLNYAPSTVGGQIQYANKYTASIKNNKTLYTGSDFDDSVQIVVTGKNNIGETYTVDPADYYDTVTHPAKFTVNTDGTVTSDIDGAGTASFTIYVDEDGDGVAAECLLDVPYDNTQTATKAYKAFTVADGVIVGKGWTDTSRTENQWETAAAASTITVTNNRMKITNGNKVSEDLYLGVNDQHGKAMLDTVFYVDGKELDTWIEEKGGAKGASGAYTVAGIAPGKHFIEVVSGSIKTVYTIDFKGTSSWTGATPAATKEVGSIKLNGGSTLANNFATYGTQKTAATTTALEITKTDGTTALTDWTNLTFTVKDPDGLVVGSATGKTGSALNAAITASAATIGIAADGKVSTFTGGINKVGDWTIEAKSTDGSSASLTIKVLPSTTAVTWANTNVATAMELDITAGTLKATGINHTQYAVGTYKLYASNTNTSGTAGTSVGTDDVLIASKTFDFAKAQAPTGDITFDTITDDARSHDVDVDTDNEFYYAIFVPSDDYYDGTAALATKYAKSTNGTIDVTGTIQDAATFAFSGVMTGLKNDNATASTNAITAYDVNGNAILLTGAGATSQLTFSTATTPAVTTVGTIAADGKITFGNSSATIPAGSQSTVTTAAGGALTLTSTAGGGTATVTDFVLATTTPHV